MATKRGSKQNGWAEPKGAPPPPYRRGSAHDELAPGQPDVTVQLSGRAFLWMWRTIEAKRLVLPASSAADVLPELVDTVNEAVESFRAAAVGEVDEIVPPRRQAKVVPRRRR